ncbi:unnamed protein product, partial [Rotaria magnacalcarata]
MRGPPCVPDSSIGPVRRIIRDHLLTVAKLMPSFKSRGIFYGSITILLLRKFEIDKSVELEMGNLFKNKCGNFGFHPRVMCTAKSAWD